VALWCVTIFACCVTKIWSHAKLLHRRSKYWPHSVTAGSGVPVQISMQSK